MMSLDKIPRPAMSFHKKFFWAYLLTHLALIVFGYFQWYATDTAGMTDQDLITHGVSKTAVYALRGLWLLGALAYRKAKAAEWA